MHNDNEVKPRVTKTKRNTDDATISSDQGSISRCFFLFYRLGDFYELFNDDAIKGAQILELTLTTRNKSAANPIPMCGVPHHAVENYIDILIDKGYKVAICEQ